MSYSLRKKIVLNTFVFFCILCQNFTLKENICKKRQIQTKTKRKRTKTKQKRTKSEPKTNQNEAKTKQKRTETKQKRITRLTVDGLNECVLLEDDSSMPEGEQIPCTPTIFRELIINRPLSI